MLKKSTTLITLGAAMFACLAAHAHAQAQEQPQVQAEQETKTASEVPSRPVKEIEPQPLWELGISGFALSQQAYPGSEVNINRVLPTPYFLYRGEHFRVDRGGTGYRAIKTPTFEFDIGFAGSFGSGSDKVTARAGMEKLGTLIEFGPRLKWNISEPDVNGKWRFELPVRGVFDLSHRFDYRGMTVEPEINFDRRSLGGWRYRMGLSAVWGNRQLAQTFYEVTPLQATSIRPAYQAEQGLILWRLSGFVSHAYSNNLRLYGGVRIDSVAGAANESSPLVRRTTSPSILFGMTYTWMRSDRREFE